MIIKYISIFPPFQIRIKQLKKNPYSQMLRRASRPLPAAASLAMRIIGPNNAPQQH
jgi:hypothetical protein